MCNFTSFSHIVDGDILPAGMRVWVVCTRTRLPDWYMILPICVPAGRDMIPYPSPYRVKPVGYSGFGYPLPSLLVGGDGDGILGALFSPLEASLRGTMLLLHGAIRVKILSIYGCATTAPSASCTPWRRHIWRPVSARGSGGGGWSVVLPVCSG